MKKLISLFISLLFISGCSKKPDISTKIEHDDFSNIAINYPITGNNILDKTLSNDINKIYNDFKKKYKNKEKEHELNIDYSYNVVNEIYQNIELYVYIYNSITPVKYVKTYVFNSSSNKFLSFNDIIKDDISPIINKKLKDEYNITYSKKINPKLFVFSDSDLFVFFNPSLFNNNEIIKLSIPLSNLNINIPIKQSLEITVNTSIKTKKNIIDPSSKVIALTFDDGPSKYTKKIIEYLKKEDAVATFFITGNKVNIFKDTLIKMLSNGNEIGNHSYSHKWLTRLKKDELKEQIYKTQEIIKKTTGYTPKLLRPTYGSINNFIRDNVDLDIVMWSVDTMDWKYKNENKIVYRATKNIKDGDIILMHDMYERTYCALTKIIPILKKRGFKFVTVSELKEINLIRNYSEGKL